jgi:hypothetical protein
MFRPDSSVSSVVLVADPEMRDGCLIRKHGRDKVDKDETLMYLQATVIT